MSMIRCVRDRRFKDSVFLSNEILLNSKLSCEGKGYYAMLEGEAIKWNEVPENIQKELVAIGYFEEVGE